MFNEDFKFGPFRDKLREEIEKGLVDASSTFISKKKKNFIKRDRSNIRPTNQSILSTLLD